MAKISLISTDNEYLNDNKEFIELENCPRGGINCIDQRAGINRCKAEAEKYILNKEFSNAINELKGAFYLASALKESTCLKCVELFQSLIIKSLGQIKSELERLTSGFFSRKRYRPDLLLVIQVLEELQKK